MQDFTRIRAIRLRGINVLLTFIRGQSAGGLALIVAAVIALAWSNGPWVGLYVKLLDLRVSVGIGDELFSLSLVRWINDGLMALFFLMVGLEIRREITQGQLAGWRKIAAPGLAAFGGMIVPAIIYAALNWRSPATLHGWAVPVATDIAFALAALSVLGERVPIGLKVFLTALAILDDLGAIVVIALFYSSGLHPSALLVAALVLAALYGVNRAGVRAIAVYLFGGGILWTCLFQGGIHPTLAGVALAFVVPLDNETSPARRLEDDLGAWVTWVVLPLFGLANSGLRLGDFTFAALTTPVMMGTILGLVLGKQIGVFGASLLGLRLRWASLPPGVTRLHLYGGSVLCGIGFTMSLFIGDLSFGDSPLHAEVKLATFIGSLVSAGLGLLILTLSTSGHRRRS